MVNSLITIAPLKNQPNEDSLHFFVGRFWAELGNCQGPRRIHKRLQLDFVFGRLKADLHSVHRHDASFAQAALPVPQQALVDRIDVILCGITKGFAGQVERVVAKLLFCMLIHGRSVTGLAVQFHSYFSRWLSMSPSSLFFAQRGQSNAVASFAAGRRSPWLNRLKFPAITLFPSTNQLIY